MKFYKRHLHKISGAVALLTCGLVLSSCTRHDYGVDDHGGDISFAAAAVDELRSVDSVAASSKETVNIIPLHAEGEGADQLPQLYLHEIVSENRASVFPADSLSDDTDTRAINVSNTHNIKNISVTAITYKGDWNNARERKPLFQALYVQQKGNIFPTTYYWPSSSYNVRFFAFAPGNIVRNHNIIRSDYTFGWNRTDDHGPEDDHDFLVAVTDNIGAGRLVNKAQQLRFRHILAGVRFVLDDGIDKVTKIRFENIYFSARYDLIHDHWIGHNDKNNWNVKDNAIALVRKASHDDPQKKPQLLFVPQKFKDDSAIKITLTIKGIPVTLSANLRTPRHQGWVKGTVTTYKISTSNISVEDQFNVTVGGRTLSDRETLLTTDYRGNLFDMQVVSQRTAVKNHQSLESKALAWHVEWFDLQTRRYRRDGIPSWLSLPPAQNNTGTMSVSPQIPVSAKSYLRERPTLQGEQDLSILNNPNNRNRAKKLRSTANCYVINQPGTYTIPLVYGNGIVEGRVNQSAWFNEDRYINRKYEKNRLNILYRHDGNEIINAYIKKNVPFLNNSTILWSDRKNLITDVMLDGDKIKFTVTKENIDQGNVLIALRGGNKYGSNDVLWSWHIWVTPTDIWDNDSPQAGSGSTRFATKLPLGWKDKSEAYYKMREVLLRFVQEGNPNNVKIVRIKQKDYNKPTKNGRPAYYQWGRKDPFVPTTRNDILYNTDNRTYKSEARVPVKATISGGYRINESILHPDFYFHNNDFWQAFLDKYYNLWDNRASSGPNDAVDPSMLSQTGNNRLTYIMPTKTVYDPSPVGFVVPPSGFFQNNMSFLIPNEVATGYIEKEGDKHGTIVVHGFGDNSTVWTAYSELYHKLGKNYYGWAAYKTKGQNGSIEKRYAAYGYPIYSVNEDWWTK